MRLRSLLAVAALGAGMSASAFGQMLAPKGELTYPVSARIEMVPSASPDKAWTVKVHVRNTVTEAGRNGVAMTLQAVLLRDVRWVAEPLDKDGLKWLAPVFLGPIHG